MLLPEDLMNKLGGGYGFTKIDLADACNQIKLGPIIRVWLALSAHRGGLLQNVLPYGISSAPGYFQRKFILLTDHNPLPALFGPSKTTPSLAANRLARWALFLSQLTTSSSTARLPSIPTRLFWVVFQPAMIRILTESASDVDIACHSRWCLFNAKNHRKILFYRRWCDAEAGPWPAWDTKEAKSFLRVAQIF